MRSGDSEPWRGAGDPARPDSAGRPVWKLGAKTKFPGLPYVVFSGNFGGPDALAEAVNEFNP